MNKEEKEVMHIFQKSIEESNYDAYKIENKFLPLWDEVGDKILFAFWDAEKASKSDDIEVRYSVDFQEVLNTELQKLREHFENYISEADTIKETTEIMLADLKYIEEQELEYQKRIDDEYDEYYEDDEQCDNLCGNLLEDKIPDISICKACYDKEFKENK